MQSTRWLTWSTVVGVQDVADVELFQVYVVLVQEQILEKETILMSWCSSNKQV